MNYQNFNQGGGFPIKTQTLDEMQTAYSVFNAFGGLSGNFSIISGCEITGTTVNNGTVYINGELFEFQGGTIGLNVIITELNGIREFKDASQKDVVFTRFASFGVAANQYPWADFKRGMPTTEIPTALSLKVDKTTITSLINRIEALENKPSNIPIGLIAIWGGLFANIPDGWVEHVPLRGRIPIGQNPDDPDFETVGSFGGAKNIKLTEDYIPEFNPANGNFDRLLEFTSFGTVNSVDALGNEILPQPSLLDSKVIRKFGKPTANQLAINLMNPYRIVHFIKYIG